MREKAISMKEACFGCSQKQAEDLNRFQADVLSHRPQGRIDLFFYGRYERCQVKYIRWY